MKHTMNKGPGHLSSCMELSGFVVPGQNREFTVSSLLSDMWMSKGKVYSSAVDPVSGASTSAGLIWCQLYLVTTGTLSGMQKTKGGLSSQP